MITCIQGKNGLRQKRIYRPPNIQDGAFCENSSRLKQLKIKDKISIKEKNSKEHKHDLIYKAQCSDLKCDETYIGEIGRGLSERIIGHSGRDDSHICMNMQKRMAMKM